MKKVKVLVPKKFKAKPELDPKPKAEAEPESEPILEPKTEPNAEPKLKAPKKSRASNIDFIISIDPAIINCAYCMIDAKGYIKLWNKIKFADSQYETNEKICNNEINIFNELNLFNNDVFKEFIETHSRKPNVVVLIEIQPGRNKKVSIISGQIQMYFALSSRRESLSNVVKIVGYSAKHKLKYYIPEDSDEPIPSFSHIKSAYSRRKKLAIEHTKRILLRTKDPFLEFFLAEKKKDDYSDSFLQALSWLFIDSSKVTHDNT